MKSDEFWKWYEDFAAPQLDEWAGETGGQYRRSKTFRRMFEYLDTLDHPVHIIETGTLEKEGTWGGDGRSTLLFDFYAQTHPGSTVRSVDIDPVNVESAKKLVTRRVKVVCSDSVAALKKWAKSKRKVDLLYLDASDFDWGNPLPPQIHHYNELMAIMPALTPQSMVVIDDSPPAFFDMPHLEIGGKGALVAQHALNIGAYLEFAEWQIGFTNMTAVPPKYRGEGWQDKRKARVEELITKARGFVEQNTWNAAAILYRLIASVTSPPEKGYERVAHGEACAFFARCALKQQKFGTSADWYRQAIAADPLATDYRLEMIINAYRPMGAIVTAKVEAERAVRISPDYGRAWHTLGGIWHELHNVEKCNEAYDKGLALNPEDDDALLDAATIALDTADYGRVSDLCSRVSSERRADADHCLAMVAYREGRHEQAIELYDKALEGKCHDAPVVHWNKSIALHSVGRYREGWIEHEWREFQKSNAALSMPMIRFTKPRWKGEDPPGLIHIHTEAGYGDQLAMLRYLPLVVERGFNVRYESMDDMLEMVKRSFPEIEVVPKAADYPGALGIKDFDYHTPIGSLPWVFGTDIDTVPWRGPYLKADPVLSYKYRSLLPMARRRKIGVCWSSGIREGIWMTQYGQNKSMHFDTIRPLLSRWDDCFVSLQVGPEREQQSSCPTIADILPKKPTWDDTAALIDNLDLVLTVDTAVAHLAGALGKPVWLMMHAQGSWHWMVERPGSPWNERSPWYPSVRIFRQQKFGQWSDVISRVAASLTEPAMIAAE